MAESFYDRVSAQLSDENKGQWTPVKTLLVAGGVMIIIGIVAVAVVRAKRR
jgi:hypothetical protein